jgi:hypothetical protein
MKNYLMLSGRRMRSDLEASAARGYLQHVGHENCVFNFLADAATTPLLSALVEQSAAPLGVIEPASTQSTPPGSRRRSTTAGSPRSTAGSARRTRGSSCT